MLVVVSSCVGVIVGVPRSTGHVHYGYGIALLREISRNAVGELGDAFRCFWVVAEITCIMGSRNFACAAFSEVHCLRGVSSTARA